MVGTKFEGLRTRTQAAMPRTIAVCVKERGEYKRLKPAAPQTARRVHASEPTSDSMLYSIDRCLLLATTVVLWIPVLRIKARRAAYTRI